MHPALAATLADAGAELVQVEADLELAITANVRGDTRWAIVALDAGDPAAWPLAEDRARAFRAIRRLALATNLRLRARSARKALVLRGYGETRTIFWDQERTLQPRGLHGVLPLRDRFRLGAIVIGARAPETPTLLERTAAQASERVGLHVTLDHVRTASWGVLGIGRTTVLRITVGPARRQLESQATALDELRARAPALQTLVPWPLAQGKTGIGDWLLEPRLAGTPAPPALSERVLAQTLDVLAALHIAGERREHFGSPLADAERLVAGVSPADAARLTELGRRIEARTAELPRSFGHGDFSYGNLLEERGSLSGIVDWNKSGQGRLPLLDLLNLLLTSEVARSGRSHGRVFVEHLLPWARAGGDEMTRAFCRRVGVELRDGVLEDLAAAWWLDRHAQQIAMYSDRALRPAWLRDNVERPLAALTGR